MNTDDPPLEAQRFGRSQTPESPRPISLPEPSNIPVLQNQMDPVFNDTSTYDIRPSSNSNSAQDTSELVREPLDHVRAQENAVENFLLNSQLQNIENHQPTQPTKPTPQGQASVNTCTLDSGTDETTIPAAHTSATKAISPSPHSVSHANVSPPRDQQTLPTASHLPQTGSVAQENLSPEDSASQHRVITVDTPDNAQPQEERRLDVTTEDGVDYQSLLENIAQSASTAPAAYGMTSATGTAPHDDPPLLHSTSGKVPFAIAGLPPKPPPQANASGLPEYANAESLGASSMLPVSNATATSPGQFPHHTLHTVDAPSENAASTVTQAASPSGLLPPPPLSSLGLFPQRDTGNGVLYSPDTTARSSELARTPPRSATERPWGPEVQALYDQFLSDERNYVTEGVWDRFPLGSRLFVGNLPTEKVTKRDLYHIFHRYGRLAQISIKQAYGFVQFLEASACQEALKSEQSVELRGRKLHLEISKPQKNTRNAGSAGNKNSARRRSRSPDRGVSRSTFDRTNHGGPPPFSDFRDESGRRRDGYRSHRSPSPRSYRSRDDYRPPVQSPLPLGRYGGNDHNAPAGPVFDDEASLPFPRRAPHDVPDVQLLILEEIEHNFVTYVEQGFRAKGLKPQTIWLNPRITLAAVIKRQIIEGVQAVVKITRSAQFSGKIPLQVFDRTLSTSNVNFNEYVELDVHIAADIVIQARQKERVQTPQSASAAYSLNHNFPAPHPAQPYPQPPHPHPAYNQLPGAQFPQPAAPNQQHYPPPQPGPYRGPSQAPPTPGPAPPNLQELLANLRQPSTSQQTSNNSVAGTPSQPQSDLAGLLSNVAARQQNQAHSYGRGQPPPQQVSYDPYRGNGQPFSPHGGPQSFGSGSQQPPQNVQNIMDQLARYR